MFFKGPYSESISTQRRFVIALEADQKINLTEILSNELLPVSLSLSEMDRMGVCELDKNQY